MEIVIDREKRLTLLRWLKRGVIDSDELDNLSGVKSLTDEELQRELDNVTRQCHDQECERIKRLGYCKAGARTLTKQEAQDFFQQLEREY
jgi:hypothetical protein